MVVFDAKLAPPQFAKHFQEIANWIQWQIINPPNRLAYDILAGVTIMRKADAPEPHYEFGQGIVLVPGKHSRGYFVERNMSCSHEALRDLPTDFLFEQAAVLAELIAGDIMVEALRSLLYFYDPQQDGPDWRPSESLPEDYYAI